MEHRIPAAEAKRTMKVQEVKKSYCGAGEEDYVVANGRYLRNQWADHAAVEIRL